MAVLSASLLEALTVQRHMAMSAPQDQSHVPAQQGRNDTRDLLLLLESGSR